MDWEEPSSNQARSRIRNVPNSCTSAFLLKSADLRCVIFICYHAATRAGQPSAIYRNVSSIRFCGFLWVRSSEVELCVIRKLPALVRFLSPASS